MPYRDKEKRKEKNREYQKKHYSQNKEYYLNKAKESKLRVKEQFEQYKKTLKCEVCGENHPATLDFHHKNPSEKEIIISESIWRWSWNSIKKEIDKCSVLCSNCHRKLHYEEKMAGGGQGVL
jgi:hypothetical protein